MIAGLLRKIFGDKHLREIKKVMPLVEEINRIYAGLEPLSDEEIRSKSMALKERISSMKSRAEQENACDEALPEAYALVKEACRRSMGREITVCGMNWVWDMIPYDVQLIGAVVLHQGNITEMATGEGKTLVAVMPLYLNALKGRGVHLVTVNDFLARRDSEWMGTIFKFLGLTVGCIQNEMDTEERRAAYNCDITYGTNNEFGFDYLRDNMTWGLDQRVQPGHHYAIVDEVDSVLIDEARTPLIISGPVQGTGPKFKQYKPKVEELVRAQIKVVNNIISEAEQALKEAEKEEDGKRSQELSSEAGMKLLQASRGMPKNKRLLKILNEVGTKKLVQRVEADYMREKRMPELDEGLYFSMDEKGNQVQLSDNGLDQLSPEDPDMFIIPDLSVETNEIESNPSLSPATMAIKKEMLLRDYLEKSDKIHTIHQLLKAYILFEKDVDYVVQEGKVLIVDEFTGRLLPGRRYSEGLHQAIEAKEGVKIEGETQTMATITLQNYFRLYEKLAGMTGTAETEANEFWEIYKLDVLVIPTNAPVVREDHDDVIYRTRKEKFDSIISEVGRLHGEGRPVLVGTVSVEVSETLSRMLKRRGIKHHVLNAKYHQQEAEIVANAGQEGAVTIATNMAGRGTDIKLGTGVTKLGGLAIVGTERHEARRIDRQLRGRSGRQGDPGSSQFFLSLQDDLMRLFGSDRIAGVMDRLGLKEGEVITHSLVSRSIGQAQKKVEINNFQIRKHLLEYDDVMNQQREVIYDLRYFALRGGDTPEDVDFQEGEEQEKIRTLEDEFKEMVHESLRLKFEEYGIAGSQPEEWNLKGLAEDYLRTYGIDFHFHEQDRENLTAQDLLDSIIEEADRRFALKTEEFGAETIKKIIQMILLQVIDKNWREHLYFLDHLKTGINFRAYGQKDPLIEYKNEAYQGFLEMMNNIKKEVTALFFKGRITQESEIQEQRQPEKLAVQHATYSSFSGSEQTPESGEPGYVKQKTIKRDQPKIGRNDLCPCGSGLKYKKCCGKNI